MKRLLFLIIPILLAWCSSIESQVSKQVQESNASVERQAELIKVATAEKIKQENIAKAWQEYLKALGWNIPDSIPNEAEAWIVNDSKPLLRTKTNAACMVWDTINIEEWFAEDYTYESDCWAFSDYGVQGCNYNYEKEPCLLNENLDGLNKLLNL